MSSHQKIIFNDSGGLTAKLSIIVCVTLPHIWHVDYLSGTWSLFLWNHWLFGPPQVSSGRPFNVRRSKTPPSGHANAAIFWTPMKSHADHLCMHTALIIPLITFPLALTHPASLPHKYPQAWRGRFETWVYTSKLSYLANHLFFFFFPKFIVSVIGILCSRPVDLIW
jgi:hypothetical protein